MCGGRNFGEKDGHEEIKNASKCPHSFTPILLSSSSIKVFVFINYPSFIYYSKKFQFEASKNIHK